MDCKCTPPTPTEHQEGAIVPKDSASLLLLIPPTLYAEWVHHREIAAYKHTCRNALE